MGRVAEGMNSLDAVLNVLLIGSSTHARVSSPAVDLTESLSVDLDPSTPQQDDEAQPADPQRQASDRPALALGLLRRVEAVAAAAPCRPPPRYQAPRLQPTSTLLALPRQVVTLQAMSSRSSKHSEALSQQVDRGGEGRLVVGDPVQHVSLALQRVIDLQPTSLGRVPLRSPALPSARARSCTDPDACLCFNFEEGPQQVPNPGSSSPHLPEPTPTTSTRGRATRP